MKTGQGLIHLKRSRKLLRSGETPTWGVKPYIHTYIVSMAECRPLSNHRSTYFEGSKSLRGGPTSLMNKCAEIVLVFNEALVGVAIRFICENPRSHSLEEMRMVFRVRIKCNSFSGYVFSRMYSRNPRIISLSFSCSLIDKFLISTSPNVT